MKLTIINTTGAEKGNIDFAHSEPVREDLIRRAVQALASKKRQPYGADPRAGLKHSTRISKRRRDYRGSYGQGISRSPRKVLSRSGRRLYYVGAEAPNTVGGRRAHPPKATKIWVRKINKKENRKAIDSALTASLSAEHAAKRGHIVPKLFPCVLDKDFEDLKKTNELAKALAKAGFAEDLARGQNGGKSVVIVSDNENFIKVAQNIPGVDACTPEALNAHILAPGAHPGRPALFTYDTIMRVTKGDKPAAKPKAPAKKPAKKAAAKKATKKAAKKTAKKPAKKEAAK